MNNCPILSYKTSWPSLESGTKIKEIEKNNSNFVNVFTIAGVNVFKQLEHLAQALFPT